MSIAQIAVSPTPPCLLFSDVLQNQTSIDYVENENDDYDGNIYDEWINMNMTRKMQIPSLRTNIWRWWYQWWRRLVPAERQCSIYTGFKHQLVLSKAHCDVPLFHMNTSYCEYQYSKYMWQLFWILVFQVPSTSIPHTRNANTSITSTTFVEITNCCHEKRTVMCKCIVPKYQCSGLFLVPVIKVLPVLKVF